MFGTRSHAGIELDHNLATDGIEVTLPTLFEFAITEGRSVSVLDYLAIFDLFYVLRQGVEVVV